MVTVYDTLILQVNDDRPCPVYSSVNKNQVPVSEYTVHVFKCVLHECMRALGNQIL